MPATAYTVEIFSLFNATGPYPIIGPSPPAGFIWVVRDVVFRFPGISGFFPRAGQAVLAVSGFPIASSPAYRSMTNVVYHVRELRQTVGAAELLEFTAGNDGWSMRATGYQLTA